MSYVVYIIQSKTTGKKYIGQTSNLKARLERHNSDYGKQRYTQKQIGPWELIHCEEYSTRSEAMKRERFLKSGQGREWIKNCLYKQQLLWQSPPPAD